MFKKIQQNFGRVMSVAALMFVFSAALVPAHQTTVYASTKTEVLKGVNQAGGSGNTKTLPEFIKNVVDILLFIIGAVSVIMIIIGGIRYVTSNGDASQTKAAQNTILYAVVGLVVAIMAYAIVEFVVNQL